METIKRFWLGFVFLFLQRILCAQSDYYFELTFTDKGNEFNTSLPSAFLSEQSLIKKSRRNIAIDYLDLPLSALYLQNIAAFPVSITHHSKWRNSVLVKMNDTSVCAQLRLESGVKSLTLFTTLDLGTLKKQVSDGKENSDSRFLTLPYGQGFNQIAMLNAHFLHERGFKGAGMDIAIFDAGFNPNGFSVFSELQSKGQIKDTWDFVDNDAVVFEKSQHGAMVLSVLANNNKNIIGVAPDANFYLFVSEDNVSENLLEEYNWLMAAERADSIGVDVINSSLGYTLFDDASTSHQYSDMNGNTTLVSRAANTAVRKGIFVVASAGNDAQKPWHYVVAPADADSVLAVGAVNAAAKYAYFSSTGPSYGGAIKPNVAAQGQDAVITFANNQYMVANGTSFSGPLMAGAAACLWQAFPYLSNLQLKKEIERSASQYNAPDSLLGFGIPNMMRVFMLLDSTDVYSYDQTVLISAGSNPFSDRIGIELYSAQQQDLNFQLMDISGRLIRNETQTIMAHEYLFFGLNDLEGLSSGIYFFTVSDQNGFSRMTKVLKN